MGEAYTEKSDGCEMILSDTAKRQAAAVGLSESKALNLAAEANAQKTVRQYGGLRGGICEVLRGSISQAMCACVAALCSCLVAPCATQFICCLKS